MSQSKVTPVKVNQAIPIFNHALQHFKSAHPTDRQFGIVELFGGPYSYIDDTTGSQFYGFAHHLCTAAARYNIPARYLTADINYDCALRLANGLAGIAKTSSSLAYHVIHGSNVLLSTHLHDQLKAGNPFPQHGIITVDPNGIFNLDTLKQIRAFLPNYSLLLNINSTTIKRIKGIKQINSDHIASFAEIFESLPSWPAIFTKVKGSWQWMLVYMNSAGMYLHQFPDWLDSSSKEGQEQLNTARYTKEWRLKVI